MEGRSRAVVDDTRSGIRWSPVESRESADSGKSGDEFQTYDSAADIYQQIDFGTPSGGSLSRIFHKGPQGIPRWLKGSQREPKVAPRRPKESQSQHQGVLEGAQWLSQGVPWHPEGSSKESYVHKNSRSTAPTAAMIRNHLIKL